MQALSVLIWVVVLTIGASEAVPKSPSSDWAEWMQIASLNADQKDELLNAATNMIKASVHGFLNRTLALCDESIASYQNDKDAMNGLKEAKGRSSSSGEPIVETIRRILREGLPSKNVSRLDPYTYESLPPLDVNIEDILQIKLQLDNGTFKGLADFEEDVSVPKPGYTIFPPSVLVNVTFDILEPVLQFITGYNLDAHAQDLDIWGIGNLTFKLFSLRVNGAVGVKGSLTTTVNPCRINISGRSSKVELTGLLGGGITSQIVGEIFTDLVDEHMNTVFSAVAELVETEMCAYFRSKTTSDWIKWVIYLWDKTMMPMPPST